MMKKLLFIITFLLSWVITSAQPYQQAGYQNCRQPIGQYIDVGWDFQIESPVPGTPHMNYCDLWVDEITHWATMKVYKDSVRTIGYEELCAIAEGWDYKVGNNWVLGPSTRIVNMGNDDAFIDAQNSLCGTDFMYYDTCHGHWHIEDFMHYYLYDQCGNLVSSNDKLGWGFQSTTAGYWRYNANSTSTAIPNCFTYNGPGTLTRGSTAYMSWDSTYAILTRKGCYPDSFLYGRLGRDLTFDSRYNNLGQVISNNYATSGPGPYEVLEASQCDTYGLNNPGAGIHLSDSLIRTLSSGYYLYRTVMTPPPCIDQGVNCYTDTAEDWIYLDIPRLISMLPISGGGNYNSIPTLSFGTNPPPTASPSTPTYNLGQPTCNYVYGVLEVTSPLGSNIQYSVDGVTYQYSTLFDSLAAGSYTLTARYGPTCTSSSVGFSVNASSSIVPPIVSITQPTCSLSTATIIVTYPIGTSYIYSIGGTTYQSSPIFNNITAGATYNVYVQSLTTGCISNATLAIVNSNPALTSAPTVTTTQPTCNDTLGTIVITNPTGGGYLYHISGAISTTRSGTTLDSLAGGLYNIYATNSSGCSSPILSVTITSVTPNTLPPTFSVRDPGCDSTVGNITILSPTGVGYTYSIDGSTYQSTTTFYGVTPGYYNVTSSLNGCVSNYTVAYIDTILSIDPLIFTITQPTCSTNTGTLVITQPVRPGGNYYYAGYEYSIDGGVTYQPNYATIANILPGTYTLIARRIDFHACIVDTTFTITQGGGSLTAPQTTVTQPSCTTSTGTIQVTSPVGANYTYSVGGAYQPSPIFSGLVPGTYYTTYKNNNNCASTSKMDTISTYYSTYFPTPTSTTRTDASPTNITRRVAYVNVDVKGTTPACSTRVQVYIISIDGILQPTALNYYVVNSPSNTTISSGNYTYRVSIPSTDLYNLAATYGYISTSRLLTEPVKFRVSGYRYNGPNTLGYLINNQNITLR